MLPSSKLFSFLLKPKASFVRRALDTLTRHRSLVRPLATTRRLFVSFTVWADCCHGSLLFVIICSYTSPLRPRAQGTRMPVYSPNHRAFPEFCEDGRLCPSIHRLRVRDICTLGCLIVDRRETMLISSILVYINSATHHKYGFFIVYYFIYCRRHLDEREAIETRTGSYERKYSEIISHFTNILHIGDVGAVSIEFVSAKVRALK